MTEKEDLISRIKKLKEEQVYFINLQNELENRFLTSNFSLILTVRSKSEQNSKKFNKEWKNKVIFVGYRNIYK